MHPLHIIIQWVTLYNIYIIIDLHALLMKVQFFVHEFICITDSADYVPQTMLVFQQCYFVWIPKSAQVLPELFFSATSIFVSA